MCDLVILGRSTSVNILVLIERTEFGSKTGSKRARFWRIGACRRPQDSTLPRTLGGSHTAVRRLTSGRIKRPAAAASTRIGNTDCPVAKSYQSLGSWPL